MLGKVLQIFSERCILIISCMFTGVPCESIHVCVTSRFIHVCVTSKIIHVWVTSRITHVCVTSSWCHDLLFTVMAEHIILCYVFLTYKYYSLKVEYTIWILYCKGNVYKIIRKYGFISYRIFIHKDHDISLMLHTRVWFLMPLL
jgi:hypothetical protein